MSDDVLTKPTVYLDPVVFSKIHSWTFQCESEISGLGLVKIHDTNSLHVYDLFLLKQECTKSDTELDCDEINRLVGELSLEGEEENLRFWWHSHAGMDVFWSGQDTKTMRILRNQNFLLSLVSSRKDNKLNLLFNLALFSPLEISINNPNFKIGSPEMEEFCKTEIEEKVTEKFHASNFSPPYQSAFANLKGGFNTAAHWKPHIEDWDDQLIEKYDVDIEDDEAEFYKLVHEVEEALYSRLHDNPETVKEGIKKTALYISNSKLKEANIRSCTNRRQITGEVRFLKHFLKNNIIFTDRELSYKIEDMIDKYLDIYSNNISSLKDAKDSIIDIVYLFNAANLEFEEIEQENPKKEGKLPKVSENIKAKNIKAKGKKK